ncbi:MAG: hypothetical protein IT250_18630 [Chitinophagaceae bacterium]|nr:hypothetical protein [Chitinophagaceae bacterium]
MIYKILFEIKVLHEFYLTQPNGQTVFELPAQTDRMCFLFNRFSRGDRDIDNELHFDLPEPVRKTFSNYHLKLLPSYAGCKVGIEVQKESLPDDTVVYRPKVALPDDLNISLLLMPKNNNWDGYTGTLMQRVTNAVYYFSNENVSSGKTFPVLSNDIPAFDAAHVYEQGEAASFGINDIRAFYADKDGLTQWLPVVGTGFVNERDRILLPLRFFYYFSPNNRVTEVRVTLKDSNGNPVVLSRDEYGGEKTVFEFKTDAVPKKILIDFTRGDVRSLPAFAADDTIFYTLEVTDTNGVITTHRFIFFDDEADLRESWGLINIQPKVTNPAFNVLDDDGFLLTRIMPDSSKVVPPIFEIRIRSRLSFWRYINDKRKKLKNEHPDFLYPENNQLVSLLPRPLSFTPFLLKKPDNTPYYLPNPLPFETTKTEDGKLFSDIFVAESALFPLLP